MTNVNIMRMSQLYAPTLKEDPADAEIASHRLLLRAGFIRKTASGVYTFLPLGKRVLAKVENIVREEMDGIGAQEIMMPALQPGELWHESGRWNDYGPELMRLVDRHDREFCLGPTHEELITSLVRNELRSYKELPLSLYQIQVKFRDEIRPRFGLLRSREFIMKDAYSFHADQESLQKTYDDMSEAYGRICDRMGMDYRPVEADPGQIGGSVTCEFMALAEAGEAELVHCTCGYAANTEAGDCLARPTVYDVPMEKVATPGVHTIAELAAFLDIPESSTVKALSGKNDEGKLVVVFIPGDHELNELKAARVAGGFTLLTDEDMEAFGLHKGSMGPVGLPEEAYVIAARSLQAVPKWVVAPTTTATTTWARVWARTSRGTSGPTIIAAADSCPSRAAAGRRARHRGCRRFSSWATSTEGHGRHVHGGRRLRAAVPHGGCYGVHSRTMAAIVEQHNDENGIMWPLTVAPAHVRASSPLTVGDDEVQPAAEKLASDLAKLGLEVVIDDRKERAGVKFADADLIGWPLQVIVGKRGLAEQKVEIKRRSTGARRDIPLAALTDALAFSQRNAKVWGSELSLFGGLFE